MTKKKKFYFRLFLLVAFMVSVGATVAAQYDDVRSSVIAPCWNCLGVEFKKGFDFK